jgi:hypothetical protein
MDGFLMGMVITGLTGLLFTVLGVYMTITGRGAKLIAGYNTMAKDEQKKYDIVALCKFIGKYIVVIGLSTMLLAFGMTFSINYSSFPVLIITIVYCILVAGGGAFVAIYCNTGNRFRN